MKHRRLGVLSCLVIVLAMAGATSAYLVSHAMKVRDSKHQLALQAADASITYASLIGQLESTMSSIGSVVATNIASDASRSELTGLAKTVPSLNLFSTVAVLHLTGGGPPEVTRVKGAPQVGLAAPSGQPGTLLRQVEERGGVDVLGLFGQGVRRTAALAMGAPEVPAGFVVYVEMPVPSGVTQSSGFPGLQAALYLGRTQTDPVLIASTTQLPLRGEKVYKLIDVSNPESISTPPPGAQALLFVVSSTSSLTGFLPQFLPWILAFGVLLSGGFMVFVLESTTRRRDLAIATALDLEEKNLELDAAMDRQMEAERTRAELEIGLRQAQRMEAIGQLAGGVAHDFNNLLMVIQAHTDFATSRLPSDHALQEDLGEVRRAAQSATALTRRLLVFSRRDLIRPSVLDVNTAVSEVVGLLRRTVGEDVSIDTRLADDLPAVTCDTGELNQVLVNLVVNARQAIAGHGQITVETDFAEFEGGRPLLHPDLTPGRYIRISVTDNGCGMPEEVRQRVFDPYFTTKGPGSGTGMGLATVYGIVKRYNGCVTVSSQVGRGSTFRVYLPTTEAAAVPETPDAPEEVHSTGQFTVLLVEDEDGVRKACRRILEKAGYRVIEAADGLSADAEIGNPDIDLLLTDVIMPGGMSGRDLATRLEAERPDVPVLFMTGYSQDEIANRGILQAGVNVVEKPFTSSELLTKVGELLSQPAATSV